MLGEFKKFVLRGNLLELAVAFILGVAFATVVTAFTNIILSFIAAIFGADVSFNHLTFTLNDTPIPYGTFITAVVSFLIVAWVLFLLVQAYNRPVTTVGRRSRSRQPAARTVRASSRRRVRQRPQFQRRPRASSPGHAGGCVPTGAGVTHHVRVRGHLVAAAAASAIVVISTVRGIGHRDNNHVPVEPTPRAEKVLLQASREAERVGAKNFVGVEQILLATLADED
jgi:large conductance mechanosensitive channel protein